MAEIQSINDLIGQPSTIRHIAQESAPIIVDHDFDFIATKRYAIEALAFE